MGVKASPRFQGKREMMERATFRDERSSRQGPLTLWPCLSVRYAKHNPISMGSASSWEVVLSLSNLPLP